MSCPWMLSSIRTRMTMAVPSTSVQAAPPNCALSHTLQSGCKNRVNNFCKQARMFFWCFPISHGTAVKAAPSNTQAYGIRVTAHHCPFPPYSFATRALGFNHSFPSVGPGRQRLHVLCMVSGRLGTIRCHTGPALYHHFRCHSVRIGLLVSSL